ncbi:lectin C-type domain protein [Ancylostoma caninum]|uniref:Lectin C-type domain protein n=1 Tax=Ancylostoma caninum TaxID=29170 RepID=A0A368FU28_ANCCA|nr:lectin C-type domain protein [Ancylostoma caninum]
MQLNKTSFMVFVEALLLGSLQVNDSWIGYYSAKYRGPFLWVDKSPKKFELWAPREPNNRDLYEACTYIEDSGKWGDLNCYNIKNFICERESCRDLPN